MNSNSLNGETSASLLDSYFTMASSSAFLLPQRPDTGITGTHHVQLSFL